jgi:hypothetical protein
MALTQAMGPEFAGRVVRVEDDPAIAGRGAARP